ncbi:MAG TPA: S8 family serine peptidase, partial [Acidimicrobiia bacterium]|nr:S8 family serine peptidase [Acidimicrobiia bacterium]
MTRRVISIASAMAILLSLTTIATAAPSSPESTGYAMVVLKSPAAAQYEGGIPGLARTKPVNGRLDPTSPAYQAYLRHLEKERSAFTQALAKAAPQARIVRELTTVLNAVVVELNGAKQSDIAKVPGATRVEASWLYRPTMNVGPYLINADDLWGDLGGQASAGTGIKVGVIDSGIDDTHPFFDCKEEITHQVFVSGEGIPTGLPTIVFDHGTHVAGTIGGCVFPGADAEPVPMSGNLSGVAPGVELHDYNVFPGFGAGFVAFGGSAFSHDIAAAIEKALLDGMDIVNMSLGGSVQGPHDLLAEASNAAVDAGLVVVVAAGNSGPGDATVESPGSAAKVITAGAATNGHLGGVLVTVGTANYVAAAGDFGPYGDPTSGDLFDVGTTGDPQACSAISADLTDKIALINRGTCTFSTKIRNAQNAGAVGVLVVNNTPGPPTAMGTDGTPDQPTIVGVMVSDVDGGAIRTGGLGATTIAGSVSEQPATANVLAGFSGRGPVPFTYQIKPDVVAPGVNVYSSVFEGQFAFFQGTSMATPHVAGAAALLMDGHSGWGPIEVKSALTNYANHLGVSGLPSGRAAVLQIGGGLVDLAESDGAAIFLDPVSVSFGLVSGNTAAAGSVEVAVTGSGSCTVSEDSALISL